MRILLISSVLLLASMSLIGCEEDLAPRSHYELPFSLYGVLSPDLDTQSVRVYQLEDFPTLGSPEPLDVVLTSTDLNTGDIQTWRDTVVVDPNGQHEYIFWAPFRAEFGHRYRVEVVRRSDGARSYADVKIPPPVTVRILDLDNPTLHVLIEGEGFRALTPELHYVVRWYSPNSDHVGPLFSWPSLYERQPAEVENGWEIEIPMLRDFGHVKSQYAFHTGWDWSDPFASPALVGVRFDVLIGDTAWNPPDGVFDPDILSHPRTMSNVQNGFGFIGGGYRLAACLYAPEEAAEKAGFYYVPELLLPACE